MQIARATPQLSTSIYLNIKLLAVDLAIICLINSFLGMELTRLTFLVLISQNEMVFIIISNEIGTRKDAESVFF